MNKPIRITLIFGLVSGLLIIPVTYLPIDHLGWVMTFKIYLLVNMALYSMLLCRWSKTSLNAVLFPLLLISGVTLWPNTYTGFILVAMGVMSWIRSGICFKDVPVRAVMAELVTMSGVSIFVLFWWPPSTLALPLAIWLFFLIQTLYFYIVPGISKDSQDTMSTDSFKQASREMERLLNL